MIKRVTENDPSAIEYMADMVTNAIKKAGLTDQLDLICTVPADKAGAEGTGIQQVATAVASRLGCTDGTNCLVRVRNKPRADQGGRNPRWHRATLMVPQQRRILNKGILLLDDVTRTGQTLWESGVVLVNMGAKSVIPMALGRMAGNEVRLIPLRATMTQSLGKD